MSLEWHVLQYPVHKGVQNWVAQLNQVYREQPALHQLDTDAAGFEWVDCNDTAASIISPVAQEADRRLMKSWLSAISLRCRATATGWAYPPEGSGASC